MGKKRALILRTNKCRYVPDVTLEIYTFDKKSRKYLKKISKALTKAGILTDSIWTTDSELRDIPTTYYTLPIYLPKSLYVNKSKFSKKIFDKFHQLPQSL